MECVLCHQPKESCLCREIRQVENAKRRIVDSMRQTEYQREVYNQLKERLENKGVWKRVCEQIGFEPGHTGSDIC